MKRCSTPLIIREMLIKTIRTYHLRLVRMSIIKKKKPKPNKQKTTNTKSWRGCGERKLSYAVGENVNYFATI